MLKFFAFFCDVNHNLILNKSGVLCMKKDLKKCLVLTCVLATMSVSTAFAGVNPQSFYQQQQLEQIRQQNEALMQQNEYLRQQSEILRQQTEAQRQNQAYTQGYMEGQGSNYRRNNNYQLYTGMGVGYVMGSWFHPRCCGWGWGRGYGCGHACGHCRH